jgi:hypothetical protein
LIVCGTNISGTSQASCFRNENDPEILCIRRRADCDLPPVHGSKSNAGTVLVITLGQNSQFKRRLRFLRQKVGVAHCDQGCVAKQNDAREEGKMFHQSLEARNNGTSRPDLPRKRDKAVVSGDIRRKRHARMSAAAFVSSRLNRSAPYAPPRLNSRAVCCWRAVCARHWASLRVDFVAHPRPSNTVSLQVQSREGP